MNTHSKNIRTYSDLILKQKSYFKTGVTSSIKFRKGMLLKLKKAIVSNEEKITLAINKDLGKSEQEVITTEIGMIVAEINGMIKNLKRWSKKKKHPTNLINFPSKSYTVREPYGITLIISPWNYPFQLALSPVVGAIAGGNTVILKPSEISSHTSSVISEIIKGAFDEEYIKVILGGVEVTTSLLEERFDKIFFTGSPRVGRIIMNKASKHLTPVVLELGGKSPCIVDKNVKLDVAVKRIIFGKATNAGQTCVAPDYILVHEDVKHAFYKKFITIATDFYGGDYKSNKDFGKIIDKKNHQRVVKYLDDGKIIFGGKYDEATLHIDLTLLEVTNLNTPIMSEEIFGPILPILTFKTVDDIISIVDLNPDPLAMYIFSSTPNFIQFLTARIHFGGGCINNTLMHLSNKHLPFGGRGTSGMGSYHGRHSFNAFTHEKSILTSPTYFDLKMKYPPFKKKNTSLLKWFMYK